MALSGVVTAVPLLLFAVAAQRVPFTLLGALQYLVPTINLGLGWFVYDESMPVARSSGSPWCGPRWSPSPSTACAAPARAAESTLPVHPDRRGLASRAHAPTLMVSTLSATVGRRRRGRRVRRRDGATSRTAEDFIENDDARTRPSHRDHVRRPAATSRPRRTSARRSRAPARAPTARPTLRHRDHRGAGFIYVGRGWPAGAATPRRTTGTHAPFHAAARRRRPSSAGSPSKLLVTGRAACRRRTAAARRPRRRDGGRRRSPRTAWPDLTRRR